MLASQNLRFTEGLCVKKNLYLIQKTNIQIGFLHLYICHKYSTSNCGTY